VYTHPRYTALRRWMSEPPNAVHVSADSSDLVRVIDRVIEGSQTRAYVAQLYIDVEPEPLPTVKPRAVFITATRGTLPSITARRAAHFCPAQYPLLEWLLRSSSSGDPPRQSTRWQIACTRSGPTAFVLTPA